MTCWLRLASVLGVQAVLAITLAGDNPLAAQTILKTERFERDPLWVGHNNRIVPDKPATVKQDFGYSATHIASQEAGEIGGTIQRSTTPASYAMKIAPRTLSDRLSASGSFAVTASQPGAGMFFGFFNSQQPGGSGRPIGSLGLDFDFEGSGGRLAVRLITGGNKSCGTFITPYVPGKYRPTPIQRDGTRYHFTLDYDPQAAGGNGRFTFTLSNDAPPPGPIDAQLSDVAQAEARIRFPYTTTFQVDLPPGFQTEGTTFDRFGLHNMMKAGGSTSIYFANVTINGERQSFATDPNWTAIGNRAAFVDREQVGAHDFGFSPETNHAGGTPGEIGGGLWRSGKLAYYADRVGPFDLSRRLEARGKVKLVTAGPDSDIAIGWFSSAADDATPGEDRNFVGIHVGGPTRVGHYFIPQLATATGSIGKVERGPILTPGKLFEWSLVYDPTGSDGLGEVRVTLGTETATLPLKAGQKQQGALLDRFGCFNSIAGGQMVKLYLDDITYSAQLQP